MEKGVERKEYPQSLRSRIGGRERLEARNELDVTALRSKTSKRDDSSHQIEREQLDAEL